MGQTSKRDFGAKLRTAREGQGISLRQIAMATKISTGALESLELGEVSSLPGGIFSRSFVRSYASEVGLDPDEMVREFLETFPAKEVADESSPADDAQHYDEFLSQQRVARTALGLVVLSIPVAAFLVFMGLRGEPEGEAPSPIAMLDEDRAGDGLEQDGGVRLATAAPIEAPPPVTEVAAVGPLTIEIHPDGPCWVSLTLDGQRVFSRVMQPGEREVGEAEREIVIIVGDAGAFGFSINHQRGRLLGGNGEVVTAHIDRDNYWSFTRP